MQALRFDIILARVFQHPINGRVRALEQITGGIRDPIVGRLGIRNKVDVLTEVSEQLLEPVTVRLLTRIVWIPDLFLLLSGSLEGRLSRTNRVNTSSINRSAV